MTASIHVAGTGTFAAEFIEYARAAGMTVDGLIELVDEARIGTERHGLTVIAPDAGGLASRRAIVGLAGDRLALWSRLAAHDWAPVAVVHPRAEVSPSSEIAAGVVIGPLAVIGAHTRVGEHALIGRGALVGHHVTIAPGAVLNPGANVAGAAHIGRSAQIGMSGAIAPGQRVGARAIVAAGAVVVRDVPDGARVQGVPARDYSRETAR